MQYLEAHVVYSIDDSDGEIFFDKDKTTISVQITERQFELIRMINDIEIVRGHEIAVIEQCVDLHREILNVKKEIDAHKPAARIIAQEELRRRAKKAAQDE